MVKLNRILFFGIVTFSFNENCGVQGGISMQEFLSLTLNQKNALDSFRARVLPSIKRNYMKEDIYLVRWLRAKNFDVSAAEKVFLASLKWRDENKIDTVKYEDWSDMEPEYHMTKDTYDKKGEPIGVLDIYDWDIRKAVLQGKGKRLIRCVINLVENLTDQVTERQRRGIQVTHLNYLMSADGANMVQQACPICMPIWVQFVQIMDAYYPLYIDELIIVDAPPAVGIVFEAIKPLISKEARDTIHIYGQNKNQWMAHLDKKISRDQRRQRYGGTKPPAQY